MEQPTPIVSSVQMVARLERELSELTGGSLALRMANRSRIEELSRGLVEALAVLGGAAFDAARAGTVEAFASALAAAIRTAESAPAPGGAEEPQRVAVDRGDEWSENPTTASLQFAKLRTTAPERAADAQALVETGEHPGAETVAHELLSPEPVRDAPKPAVLTQETMEALRQKLAEGRVGREVAEVNRERETLRAASTALIREMFERYGRAPSHLRGRKPVQRELSNLQEMIQSELGRWAAAPKHVNHALTSWTAARLRSLQEAIGSWGEPGDDVAIDRMFPVLGEHSRESQPGTVHGLARGHVARGEHWMADAHVWDTELRSLAGLEDSTPAPQFNPDDALRRFIEDVREGMDGEGFVRRTRELLSLGVSPTERRLVRAAIPFGMDLDGSEFAPLRRAIAYEVAADAREEDVNGLRVPADWPWLERTQGRRVVIVGGDPRPERVVRLRDAFGFGELEWIDNAGGGLRHADALVQRMYNGTVDLVIVLRAFSSHKLSDKIFGARDSGCAVVLADTYGITAVQLGIERYLSATPAPAAR